MSDDFTSYDRRLARQDELRAYDDGPTLANSGEYTPCIRCYDRAAHVCAVCGRDFCYGHIEIIWKSATSRDALEEVCEECLKAREDLGQALMIAEPKLFLLDASDHQRLNPFDSTQSEAINKRFDDGIYYGVWDWRRKAA